MSTKQNKSYYQPKTPSNTIKISNQPQTQNITARPTNYDNPSKTRKTIQNNQVKAISPTTNPNKNKKQKATQNTKQQLFNKP